MYGCWQQSRHALDPPGDILSPSFIDCCTRAGFPAAVDIDGTRQLGLPSASGGPTSAAESQSSAGSACVGEVLSEGLDSAAESEEHEDLAVDARLVCVQRLGMLLLPCFLAVHFNCHYVAE